MPKTKKAPPLDLAWGAVLSRQRQLGLDMQKISQITGYHYDTIRRTMSMPPIEWPAEQRNAIMTALGLKATLVITDADE